MHRRRSFPPSLSFSLSREVPSFTATNPLTGSELLLSHAHNANLFRVCKPRRDTQETKDSLSLFPIRRTSEYAKFARKSRRHRRQFVSYQWWTFNIAGIREIERYWLKAGREISRILCAYLAYGKIRVCFMRRIYMGTFAKENHVLSRSAGKMRCCGWTKYFRIQTKIENRYRLRYNLGYYGYRGRERGTERNIKTRGGDKWTTSSIQTRVRHRCSTRLTSLKRSSFQRWRVLNAI